MEPLEDRRLLASLLIKHPPRLQLGDAPLAEYSGTTTDQVQILWQTVPAGASTTDTFLVDYRNAASTDWTSAGAIDTIDTGVEGRINHFVDILGLLYDSDYEYRVQQLRDNVVVANYQETFHTRLPAGDAREFTFAAYGDSADDSAIANFQMVQDRINQIDPAFAVTLGDNAYGSGSHGDFDARFDPNLNSEAALWTASHIDYLTFGNHDIKTASGRPLEENIAVPVPVAGVSAPAGLEPSERAEHNYSFDYGMVHYATFDSNSVDDAARLNAQLDWLEADLAASTARWKIVVAHHPVAGTPDKPETPANNYYKQVVPRLRAAGVDLLLTGHSHVFSWTYPLIGNEGDDATFVFDADKDYTKGAGLVQVVSGVGGRASLRPGDYSQFPFVASGYTLDTATPVEFGISQIDVTFDQLIVSYVAADDGAIIDRFTITDSNLPGVSVAVTDADATETGEDPGEISVTRTGDLAGPLVVAYTVAGSASNGVDYAPLTGTVTIPDGQASATIVVTPVDDKLAEGPETVSVLLSRDAAYVFGGGPSHATLDLEDNERRGLVFASAVDTQLHEVFPDTDYSTQTSYTVDSADGGGEVQVLLRFDNLFGDGAGRIPLDARIISATLEMVVVDEGNSISFYRMLRSWRDSDTWNSLSGGVQTDNVEAVAIADVRTGRVDIGNLTVDVLSSVENWQADPDGNFGWLLRGGSSGVDLRSAESSDAPRLLVQYEVLFPDGPDPASIKGTLWVDENSDEVIDPNETRLGNRTVYLDANRNGQQDFGELFQLSEADGSYTFADLPAGGYTVAQLAEPGYQQISPVGPAHPNGVYLLALGSGETAANVNFGSQIDTVAVTWQDPADITFGTELSAVQLNATADRDGTFVYTPPLGTVLDVGPSQTLTVTFTPSDQEYYNVVAATVQINVIATQDFGDAPDVYPVRLADDGARHKTTTLRLGSDADIDADGQPTEAADGDGDDDDGVLEIASMVADAGRDTAASFRVDASEAGKLDAWIDFNRDGDWNDFGEQVFSSVNVSRGANTLGFTIPRGAMAGDTAARFRISGTGGLAPTGSAPDGEVEDYLLQILDVMNSPDAEVEGVGSTTSVFVAEGQVVVQSELSELFRAPVAKLGSLAVLGNSNDETYRIDVGPEFEYPMSGLQLSGGAGANTLVVVGSGSIDFTNALLSVTNFPMVDLSGGDANFVTVDVSAVASLAPASKELIITTDVNDQIVVADADTWRLADPLVLEGIFMVTAKNIAGNEVIAAELSHTWRNFLRAGDVNNDGSITASDALRIINELDRREYSDRNTQDLTNPLDVAGWPNAYFDHNGDDRATALDALRVINEITRQLPDTGEGEAMAAVFSEPRAKDNESPPEEDIVMITTRRLRSDASVSDAAAMQASVTVWQGNKEAENEIESRAVDQLLTGCCEDLLEDNAMADFWD